ncbi:MAG: DUF86 domain-containing protein [Candidatus Altiarchaeota archaeon]|nr:DUF86 domain-containing protein [Candidatus Altiarchaeota archaeon]
MKREQRYLKKIETLEKEVEFINTHKMEDGVSRRAVFYSLGVCIEIMMDLVAMKVKDSGLVVEDDYTNLEKLQEDGVLDGKDTETLRKYDGMRNIIIHRYNKVDTDVVKEGAKKIDGLMEIALKITKD